MAQYSNVESLLEGPCGGTDRRFIALSSKILRQLDKGLGTEIEAGHMFEDLSYHLFDDGCSKYLLVFDASLVGWGVYLHA